MLCGDVVNGLGDTAVVVFSGFSRPSPTSQFFAYVAMFAFNVFGDSAVDMPPKSAIIKPGISNSRL